MADTHYRKMALDIALDQLLLAAHEFQNADPDDCADELQRFKEARAAVLARMAGPGEVVVPDIWAKVFEAYEAETEMVPLGDENRSLGASVYNWRRRVVRDLREKHAAMLAARPNNGGNDDQAA